MHKRYGEIMTWIIESNGRRRKAKLVDCTQCGTSFKKRLAWVTDKNYCGRSCASAASKIDRIELRCDFCNKTFKRLPLKMNNSSSGLYFCTRKCKDSAQKFGSGVGLSSYNTGNRVYRKYAFENYQHMCANDKCGYDDYDELLDVHHIDMNRMNNNLENLIILCVRCHYAIHRGVGIINKRRFEYV